MPTAPAWAWPLALIPLLLETEAKLGWEGEQHLGLWLWDSLPHTHLISQLLGLRLAFLRLSEQKAFHPKGPDGGSLNHW